MRTGFVGDLSYYTTNTCGRRVDPWAVGGATVGGAFAGVYGIYAGRCSSAAADAARLGRGDHMGCQWRRSRDLRIAVRSEVSIHRWAGERG